MAKNRSTPSELSGVSMNVKSSIQVPDRALQIIDGCNMFLHRYYGPNLFRVEFVGETGAFASGTWSPADPSDWDNCFYVGKLVVKRDLSAVGNDTFYNWVDARPNASPIHFYDLDWTTSASRDDLEIMCGFYSTVADYMSHGYIFRIVPW